MIALTVLSILFANTPFQPQSQEEYAIRGATLVDVSHQSSAARDVEDATVWIRNGQIYRVGATDELELPVSLPVIDASGCYLVPGLVDCFAALNNQSYANAYLHMGVTSVVSVSSRRRGGMFTRADPGPHQYPLESVGFEAGSTEEHLAELERIHAEGFRVALLMYGLDLEQLRVLQARAEELGMATIGELGRVSYADGAELGLNAFVHTTRYSLDLAPEAMRAAVAAEPFSDDLASPKWLYYKWLAEHGQGETERLREHARRLSAGGSALIPTFGLLYLDQPEHSNPWDEPTARLIDPRDVDRPADRSSGKHSDDAAHMRAYAEVAAAELAIERAYVQGGARYLAGSGTDVWGTMPGISLHHELEYLQRIGLSPREVLRTASFNVSEQFGWHELGAIEAGRRADLLILREDPRESVQALRAIKTVVLAGVPLAREPLLELDTRADGRIVDQWPIAIPAEIAHDPEYAYLKGIELSTIDYLSDGLRVKGMLAAPRAPGEYPCLIYCRGGNREFGALSPGLALRFLAKLASWGYVVVASQYRGNAGGEGREEFGGSDVNDVLNLIPLLEFAPHADASRIGIYGGSRGGMMTYLALCRSKRFRAAVTRNGLSDLLSWREERPGIESVFEELIPGYDQDPEASLLARSPARFAERLAKNTPILMLHGTSDWRVSPQSGLRMAEALLGAKQPFKLVMLEGADHSLSGHHGERDALTRDWFDRFVRDGQPLPNMEPHGD